MIIFCRKSTAQITLEVMTCANDIHFRFNRASIKIFNWSRKSTLSISINLHAIVIKRISSVDNFHTTKLSCILPSFARSHRTNPHHPLRFQAQHVPPVDAPAVHHHRGVRNGCGQLGWFRPRRYPLRHVGLQSEQIQCSTLEWRGWRCVLDPTPEYGRWQRRKLPHRYGRPERAGHEQSHPLRGGTMNS